MLGNGSSGECSALLGLFLLGQVYSDLLNVLQTCSCTLAHATSWEVDRAHWVAAAITRFWSTVSSATWATFLAFSTNMAAALATALARFIRMSYNNNHKWQRWKHTNYPISNIICPHTPFYNIFISLSSTEETYCGICMEQIQVKLLFNTALCSVCSWVLLHSEMIGILYK